MTTVTGSIRARIDLWVVLAFAWLGVALGLTLVFGPRLGLRGWVWLGLHHLLCLVGVTHELRRGWRRRQARLAFAREVEARRAEGDVGMFHVEQSAPGPAEPGTSP